MKRKVELDSVGTEGVRLTVTFTGGMPFDAKLPGSGLPRLKTQTSSDGLTGSAPDSEFHVTSPEFLDVEKAEQWIEELTQEVKQIDEVYSQLVEAKLKDFKKLEGEIEI